MGLDRPLETPGANWAAGTAAILIAQQVAGKAVRDALFLSSFHAHSLPFAMAIAAVLSLAAVLWLGATSRSRSPAKVLPLLFAASAVAFTLEWTLGLFVPRVSALLVYLHIALFGATLMTTFWSLINERFDPHAAKRAVARIAGGGTIGGILGAIAAWRASTLLPLPTLLLFLAALNAFGVVGSLRIRARSSAETPDRPSVVPSAPQRSVFEDVRKSPYLRSLASLVLVSSAMATLLDYVLGAQAELAFARGAPLLSFFSLFWLAVSVASFLVQIALGRIALERFGLAVSIAVLPAVVILTGGLGLAVPGLLGAALLRAGEAVQRNTLFRSAYELLYTPLAEERKRATKGLIDVGFDRLGTVLGSGSIFVILRVSGHRASWVSVAVAVALALVMLPLARRLHTGYVIALRESLRVGAKKLEPPLIADAVKASIEVRDREKLIEEVEALHPTGLTAHLEIGPGNDLGGAARSALENPDPSLAAARILLTGDPPEVRAALAELSAVGPLPGCAILLLAHPSLHGDAVVALRRVAPEITGQLVDALLSPTMDFVVRRRVPRVLSAAGSQRAADGLLLALATERFEVRYQCARALLHICEAGPLVSVPHERVIEAVQREIELGKKVLESVADEDYDDEMGPEEAPSVMQTLARDRVDRSLEHVFTLLAIHLEREPLGMAFRALHHEDERHRGTALEYLDTVLPNAVRAGIWPYLGTTAPLRTARAAKEILKELESAT